MPRTISKILGKLLGFGIAVYLGLCLVLFAFQDSLLYHPTGIGNPAAPTLKLAVDGAEISVTEQPRDGADAVIYFGGNGDDVSILLALLAKAFPNYAVYAPFYRSYGGSTGKPNEAALQADALAVFDRVVKDHPRILVVGRSLGTGIATRLASQRRVMGLVLITPFNSIEEIAEYRYPIFPVSWLLRDKYESWRYAPHIHVPTLLLAASGDTVIPRFSTDKLYGQFNHGVAELAVVPDTDHVNIMDSRSYLEKLWAWQRRVLGRVIP